MSEMIPDFELQPELRPRDSQSLRTRAESERGCFGVYPGLVEDLVDPEAAGRVRVRLFGILVGSGDPYAAWAHVATLTAGMAKFSGVVQVDTLIANSVISSSYSLRAGNIW